LEFIVFLLFFKVHRLLACLIHIFLPLPPSLSFFFFLSEDDNVTQGKSDVLRLGPKFGALGAFWHLFFVDHPKKIITLLQSAYGISKHRCGR